MFGRSKLVTKRRASPSTRRSTISSRVAGSAVAVSAIRGACGKRAASTESPMYRYNVLIGTKDMMKKPYESYQPGKEAT